MRSVLFVCCLVFGAALAVPTPQPNFRRSALLLKKVADTFDSLTPYEKIETINEFVDMVLTELGYLLIAMKMDPLALPDVTQKFTGGTLTMSDGLLQGVSQIFRDKDVYLFYDEETRILNSDVSFIFRNFQLDYDYGVKMWALNTAGKINGTVKDVRLNFKIDVNFEQLHITLVNFAIEEIEDITVKFEGGVIGSIVNVISGLVVGIFKNMITEMLSTAIGGTLSQVIDELNKVLAEIKNPTPDPELFNRFIFRTIT